MEFLFRRRYIGPLRAIIFDWAGTTVDYGSFAPVVALTRVFAQREINVTVQQARLPMGLHKRDHIRAITQLAPVAEQWQAVYGRPCSEADVEVLYQELTPVQEQTITAYADLIPGVLETVRTCHDRGIKVGSTTGYNRRMMAALLPLAAQQGYQPDALVCPDEVSAGRPAPWMAFQNAMRLEVYPMSACVKVGDTIPDIEEGLNAGMWTIGLAQSSNELGLPADEVAQLAPAALNVRLEPIYRRLHQAGAHYVVDTIADVPPLLDEITARLRQGEQP